MSRNEAYGYAVARVRALEPLLLDASQLQRMMEADGSGGVLKIMGETNYSRWLTDGDSRYDAVLESELAAVFGEFEMFVPDKALIDVFKIPYDFHNVKVVMKGLFKARSGGKKRYDLLTRLGSVSPDDLAARIESEEYELLPYGLSQMIPAAMSVWEQSKDIVEIERILDKGMFVAMRFLAKSVDVPGVEKWAQSRIDAENIRNLLRVKRFGFDVSAALTFLHEGGIIAPSALAPLIAEPFDGWGRALAYSDVGQAISAVSDDGDFDRLIVALERALDDYCSAELANARYSASAPENILAYLWGKEMEVKNIRTILVSKGTNSDSGEVRRMMRRGYY